MHSRSISASGSTNEARTSVYRSLVRGLPMVMHAGGSYYCYLLRQSCCSLYVETGVRLQSTTLVAAEDAVEARASASRLPHFTPRLCDEATSIIIIMNVVALEGYYT